MAVPSGKFMTWFALAEGVAVFAILGSDWLTHKKHDAGEREALISKVTSALSQGKLTVDVDPAAAHQSWYDAAKEVLATDSTAANINADIHGAQKIPLLIRSHGELGQASMRLELTAKEMQEVALASRQLVNPEMADILAHAPEHLALEVSTQQARDLAQSIADNVPGNRAADFSTQGRMNDGLGRAA